MTIPRKKNIAGYYDELGRFRPIRSPKFVGSPKRKATAKQKAKYSRAKAGDLGKKRQERAREDIFDREIRKLREQEAATKRDQERIMREIERDIYGGGDIKGKGQTLMQYVRSVGGIRRTANDAEEVNRLSFKETGKRGLATDKGGRTLDGMFQNVREAGYDVSDMWDMVNRIEDEAKHGNATYVTHGYMDYRDNPKNRSDLFVSQLGVRSYGVFLKKYLLKKFQTKVAAEKYRDSIKARAKNPASAARLAKAAIGVFDTDYDLDLDVKDISRLKRGEKRIKKAASKTPSRSRAKKNPTDNTVASIILKQLGGNKFLSMTGAKNLGTSGNDLSFRLPTRFAKKGIDYVVISLTPSDLYDVEYGKLVKYQKKVIHVSKGIFVENLIDDFRQQTGLDVSLGSVRRRNPLEPVVALTTGLSGIVSALTIKKMMAEDEEKKAMKRKTPTKRKTNGRTTAKRRTTVKKAVARKVVKRKNPATSKAANEREFNSALLAIKRGDYAKAKTAMMRGRLAGYSAREVDLFISNAKLSGRLAKKLKSNPPKRKAATVAKKAVARSAKKNPQGFRAAVSQFKHLLKRGLTVEEAKRWMKQNWTDYLDREDLTKISNAARTVPRHNPKTNPVKAPRRRTFEMFQGRPVSQMKAMPVSRHAPDRLDQLGDLIEIKLADGQILKMNPKRFKLCAAGGKLWIAGGTFAKANPGGKTNELNPVGQIDHVVYATYKPHHGDHNLTHYIHKLGEETGHMPTLAVDRDGFPVIRGGKYKIEARGIVN